MNAGDLIAGAVYLLLVTLMIGGFVVTVMAVMTGEAFDAGTPEPRDGAPSALERPA